jgi:pyridoxamine 5'-phosphate oxidase
METKRLPSIALRDGVQHSLVKAPFAEPFKQFAELYERAKIAQPKDPNACVLATVDATGKPSARVILLKEFDESGFVFFTNYDSQKGHDLLGQKVAALVFYWPAFDSQVRVEGPTAQLPAAESDAYFASRPKESQIGAWASHQSKPLSSRAELIDRYDSLTRQYADKDVPRPAHWGGFRLTPVAIELWQAGTHRLHERRRFTRSDDGWEVELLNP